MDSKKAVTPVLPSERFLSLDVLRGIAILGILVMNIQSFSMIEAAYINPNAYGDLSGLNRLVWILSHIFTDFKFITIFSILFGAGIVLFTEKAEAKGRNAARFHYRRMFWLFIIGMMHAYLFWQGDILVPYSICALFVFLFRKVSPKKLFVIGFISISVTASIYFAAGMTISSWPVKSYQGNLNSWAPALDIVKEELSAMHSGFLDQLKFRISAALKFQILMVLLFGWRTFGLMLWGMALYKGGVLTAKQSKKFYLNMTIPGFLVGFPIVIYGVIRNFSEQWTLDFSMYLGFLFNYWGSLFIAMGYIGLIMLLTLNYSRLKLVTYFALVGRSALSNYLLQTLICTTLFYGHGFGLFGRVDRVGQIIIVFAVWIFQVYVTTLWFRRFQFGPVEWIWRSLTYVMLQPLKIKNSQSHPLVL